MARDLYCWRCDKVVPMLEEHEWELFKPAVLDGISDIKAYRGEHNVSIAVAKENGAGRAALDKYRELTGYVETDVNVLWHHHVGFFGPPVPRAANRYERRGRATALRAARCAHERSLDTEPLRDGMPSLWAMESDHCRVAP